MKNIIINKLQKDSLGLVLTKHTPKGFKSINPKYDRYSTLSWVLFDEIHESKLIERYNNTLYNTRTGKITKFVACDTLYNKYQINAAVFAWQIDPLAAKYPMMSPYVAFANNPIIYFDPDGRNIVIWYQVKNAQGKEESKPFLFNGKNQAQAPLNDFVHNVIKAYNYNVTNGGGKSMFDAATDPNIRLGVTNAEVSEFNSEYSTVYWNFNAGLLTDEGYVLSPSTVLEHEIDHGLDFIKDPIGHFSRSKPNSDSQFGTKEEKRVIKGSEKTTGHVNKEIPKGYLRKSHNGATVIVEGGVTSKKANKQKSIQYYNKMEKNTSYDCTKKKEKIKNNLK